MFQLTTNFKLEYEMDRSKDLGIVGLTIGVLIVGIGSMFFYKLVYTRQEMAIESLTVKIGLIFMAVAFLYLAIMVMAILVAAVLILNKAGFLIAAYFWSLLIGEEASRQLAKYWPISLVPVIIMLPLVAFVDWVGTIMRKMS